jgi:SAM-dependent methyltransferase
MKIAPDWFRYWFNSPYYYELYAERNDLEAEALVEKLVLHLQPPTGSKMLDAACGRGRHARILARMGFDVTGIDLAPEAIAFARQFESENLHFYQHDMRLPCWINYFDFAFNFFTSFGYFQTLREHHAAIRSIGESLKWNGRFILDYVNSEHAEANLIPETNRKINGHDYQILKSCDKQFFYKQITIQNTGDPEPLVFTERIVKFTLDDFRKMFAAHQLKITELFGDYDLHPFNPSHSPRLLMIAVRETGGVSHS